MLHNVSSERPLITKRTPATMFVALPECCNCGTRCRPVTIVAIWDNGNLHTHHNHFHVEKCWSTSSRHTATCCEHVDRLSPLYETFNNLWILGHRTVVLIVAIRSLSVIALYNLFVISVVWNWNNQIIKLYIFNQKTFVLTKQYITYTTFYHLNPASTLYY